MLLPGDIPRKPVITYESNCCQKGLLMNHPRTWRGERSETSVRAGYPIKKGDTIIGAILLGMNLSSDFRFVDEMKKDVRYRVYYISRRYPRIDDNYKRRTASSRTKMDNPELLKRPEKRRKFLKRNVILGKDYNTVYWPIKNAEGKIAVCYL